MIPDTLTHTLLVGTARDAATDAAAKAAAAGPLAGALATVAALPDERRLLAAIALHAAHAACGRKPVAAPPLPAPADDEARPSCSPAAATILTEWLGLFAGPTQHALLAEAIARLLAAGRRLPHALLPALLDYAAGYAAARPVVVDLAGVRGRWLMTQNPAWRLAADSGVAPQQIWTTGTRAQRLDLLRRTRSTDPAAGLALVQSTWAEDGAEDRAAFADALRVGLNDTDEPFLEAALDDRGKTVRVTAADLLARLPASAYVARMIARAAPLLTFTPPAAGGILKKAKRAKIGVTLPAAFDKAWERDGLVAKPIPGRGERQWWLQQLIERVPPSHWTSLWQTDAATCVAAGAGDFADVLREAWSVAARRHADADADWIEALNRTATGDDVSAVPLLDALPPGRLNALTAELLTRGPLSPEIAARLLSVSTVRLERPAAEAAIAFVERYAASGDAAAIYRVGPMLASLAVRVPPASVVPLGERWSGEEWQRHARGLDAMLRTLRQRYDFQKELEP